MENKELFIKAVQANQALIYKVASVYTDNFEDRKDLVQEIIYNLWKSFDSFNHNSALTTWMYRVAMNVSIYQFKLSKRKIATVTLDTGIEYHTEASDNEDEDKLKVLKTLLNNLNLIEKGIVMLYLEDKSYAEIALIVGISESNVGTRITRIREKLRKQIKNT
jgi:RNA polymerase sigma factor (sigma-70 family)